MSLGGQLRFSNKKKEYEFRDLSTGLIHKIIDTHPNYAVSSLNKKLNKMVDYELLSVKRILK